MSTRPARRPRPAAKKPAEEVAPVAPVPAPVETPAPAEPAAETLAEVETQKSRVHVDIGVSLAPARVRRHLDKLTLNAALGELTAPLKKKHAEYKQAKALLEPNSTATDEQKTAAAATVAALEPGLEDLVARIDALSSEKVRFSSHASVVLTIICDEFSKQVLKHAIDSALASDVKTAKVQHLHAAGVEKLSLYPLVSSLPSFKETASQLAVENNRKQNEQILTRALLQAERAFKKKYEVKGGRKEAETPASPAPAPQEPAAAPEPEAQDDDKKPFKHYIKSTRVFLKSQNEAYSNIKISDELKSYLSDLIVEFIKRIAPLVMLTTKSIKNKTVSEHSILKTVESLLIDGHEPVETLELQSAVVEGKTVYTAVRTVSYPNSGFTELNKTVDEKLALLKAAEAAAKASAEAAKASA